MLKVIIILFNISKSGKSIDPHVFENEKLISIFNRFEKNDILRIIRALATFRPSLIALQMPLSEEDEVSLHPFGRIKNLTQT